MPRWGLALSVLGRIEEAQRGMSTAATCEQGHAAALQIGRRKRGWLCHLMAQQPRQSPLPDKGVPTGRVGCLQRGSFAPESV